MNAKRLFRAGFVFLLLALLMASVPAAPRPTFAAGEAQVVRDKFAYLPLISKMTAQAIVVNHENTDISQIPDYWLGEAKKLMVHYAHTSHGSQVLSGLEWLEDQNSKYNVDISTSLYPTDTTALRFYDGNGYGGNNYITPEMYWATSDGITHTRSVVSPGQFDYSLWTWCGQMSESSTNVTSYLNVLTQLENDYPGTRFIYYTGHTDGSTPTSGSALWTHNNQVRSYVNTNAKILFDFADIESYDPSGTFYPTATDSCPWCNTWCTNHPTECSSLPSDCAHSHGLQCKLKGQAFWWLMARLAGWPGPTE